MYTEYSNIDEWELDLVREFNLLNILVNTDMICFLIYS